jgi:hypothetical protein
MKRHSLDLVALLFGCLFLIVGGGFLIHELTGRDVDAAWMSAFVFIGLGAIALAVTLGRRNDQHEVES